jgi:hypothetical protein
MKGNFIVEFLKYFQHKRNFVELGPTMKDAGHVPYHGSGRSRSHRGHVRAIKKRQRRRAFYRSLKG